MGRKFQIKNTTGYRLCAFLDADTPLEIFRPYAPLERMARASARVGRLPARALGRELPPPAPSALPETERKGAAAVYMPACINRIFGNSPVRGPHPSLPEALVAVPARAGLPVWIPPDVAGHCCGTPWSSKGSPTATR